MNEIQEKIFELEECIYNMHFANIGIIKYNRLSCFKDAAEEMKIFNENFDYVIELLAELKILLKDQAE